MPAFSEEDIHKVREANDIVELFSERTTLRRRGRDFWCCCPFHQEKTPSCKIDPATQTWHCFGCGEGGDVISYVRKLDDVGFVDAIRFLARRANIEIKESPEAQRTFSKKARLKEVCGETARYYHTLLMRSTIEGVQSARDYLANRGLGGEIPNLWELGYAPGKNSLVSHLASLGYTAEEMIEANVAVGAKGSRSGARGTAGSDSRSSAHGANAPSPSTNSLRDRFFERVMFPIKNISGEVIAFGGRVIGTGEPKYLNTGETPIFHKSEVLFGLDKAKKAMAATGDAIICEGYTDVIALHQAGFTNAVATLGTSLTRQHIRILSHHAKSRIIYLFDGDEAGQRAAERALSFIDSSVTPEAGAGRVDLFALTLPEGLDPAEYLTAHGPDELNNLLQQAIPLIRYGIDRRLSRYDLTQPEGRGRALVDALNILAPIKDSLLAKDYAVYIAGRTRAQEQDVLYQLSKLKVPRTAEDYAQSPGRTQGRTHGQGQNQGRGQGQSPAPKRILSASEKNRILSEREFLSLCAQNPAMVPEFLNVLGQTNWHDKAHSMLANVIMDIICSNPSITVADLIAKAQQSCPYAEKVLTSSLTQGYASSYDTLKFLGEELSLGDLEEAVSDMKDSLSQLPKEAVEEKNQLFQAIVALQNEINTLRARHR